MNTPSRHLADSIELEKSFSENYWMVRDQDIICIPSLTFSSDELSRLTGNIHYEERQLFNILLLKNPSTRLIYLSSYPLDPSIIAYYKSLIPSNVSRADLDKRLIMLSTNDISSKSLAEKVLERPLLIERIKKLIRPNHGLLLCFTCTEFECEIAKKLGIPIFGNDNPEAAYWGSKSGSREIFEEAGIPCARGVTTSHSSEELASKIVAMLNEKPAKKMVVKLNHGFGGQGNALLDLSEYYGSGQKISEANVLEALSKMHYFSSNRSWEEFQKKITLMGAIAEEFFEGEDPKSPSVQGCISMLGDVEILSTHEQVLNGQIYQGCVFPASDNYRALLKRYGRRVGRLLAKNGVRGHFGVDFLVNCHQSPSSSPADGAKQKVEMDPTHDIFALEINLRQCGTTHPYFTMKFLTEGAYDKKTGLCTSSKGCQKYYTSSDNIHKEKYRGLLPLDLFDAFKERSLLFDNEKQSGIVFHLLGALSEHGKVGIICVGDSKAAASKLFVTAQQVMDEMVVGMKPLSPRQLRFHSESPAQAACEKHEKPEKLEILEKSEKSDKRKAPPTLATQVC